MSVLKPELNIRYGVGYIRNESKRRFICELLERLKNVLGSKLISIAVFGSVGRGTDDEYSDLDMIIVVDEVYENMIDIRSKIVDVIHSIKIKDSFLFDIDLYLYNICDASKFNMIYLDMTTDSIIVYDKNNFLRNILNRVVKLLRKLGSVKVVDGNTWFWILKPDLRLGEEIKLEI